MAEFLLPPGAKLVILPDSDDDEGGAAPPPRRKPPSRLRRGPFFFKVAGISHRHQACQTVFHLPERMRTVTLENQPENAFDPNAIAVKVHGLQIGFVPRHLTHSVRDRLRCWGHSRPRRDRHL